MARSIRKRNPVKASTYKSLGKHPPGDKNLRLDTYIRFYEIEDGDNTEEWEDAEIIITHDKSLAATIDGNYQEITLF